MKNVKIEFQPSGRRIKLPEQTLILTAAQKAGIDLSATCGGFGRCGDCKVKVANSDLVSKITDAEKELLGDQELSQGVRLACRAALLGDTQINIPQEAGIKTSQIKLDGQSAKVDISPSVAEKKIRLPYDPDINGDADLIIRTLKREYEFKSSISIPLNVLKKVPITMQHNRREVYAITSDKNLVDIRSDSRPLIGLAVDIGTTKIAGYLLDLKTGEILASHGKMNPQISFGEDVISRINYTATHDNGTEILHKKIIEALEELTTELCEKSLMNETAFFHQSDIVDAVIVGNTAMHHLFLGLPVRQLGVAPFRTVITAPVNIQASDVGLSLAPGAGVHLLPNIDGFVGADHISMLMAGDVLNQDGVTLYIDIGTNTEITLKKSQDMISCSTASGPAFEGAHIKNGVRAFPGAIEHVNIDDNTIVCKTIGDLPAIGICGSGIIDAIAELKRVGAITLSGQLIEAHPLVKQNEKGCFVILKKNEDGSGEGDIILTRKDINEIQLAKGAIRTGIEILMDELSVESQDINSVFVAGAFGSYIHIESALKIGMFPDIPAKKFIQIGNAAGAGAQMALLSTSFRDQAENLSQMIKYIELSRDKRFNSMFAKGLYL
jgi:uncharacterized 2Fe-2S/4Fe-4S cluster protein (DUF4445 family)